MIIIFAIKWPLEFNLLNAKYILKNLITFIVILITALLFIYVIYKLDGGLPTMY